MGAALSERRMWLSPDSQHRVAPRGGSGIEYAGFRVYVVEGITQRAKHPAPGVAGSHQRSIVAVRRIFFCNKSTP